MRSGRHNPALAFWMNEPGYLALRGASRALLLTFDTYNDKRKPDYLSDTRNVLYNAIGSAGWKHCTDTKRRSQVHHISRNTFLPAAHRSNKKRYGWQRFF